MKKAAINRMLALRLEYHPEWSKKKPDIDYGREPSDKGFWEAVCEDGMWTHHEPVNFFTSEEASARLFDFMRKGDSTGIRTKYFRMMLDCLIFSDSDRKTTVAQYACMQLDIDCGLPED